MIRATYGVTAMTSVSVGRIIAFMWSQGLSPGEIRLIAGSAPLKTFVENTMIRSRATTNSGSAASSRSEFVVTLSKIFSRRRAA